MNKFKKTIPYIINALLVTIIFLIALKINKIFPFGEFSLPKNDAIFQYQPMLYSFIEKIKEGILLNYSFNNNLGQPFIFNFLYYLASPLNLLVIPLKNANSMFLAIIIIKIIITSITTTFYVKRKTNNNYLTTIIAISYVFSSWFLAYYYTIMWLDAFMMLPLFQYGLEELMEKNKYNIYIFSLAYIMISNFYIAFMICLYTLIYYLYNIILKKDKYINKIKNFQLIMFITIITCLLSAFHIYKTYDSFLIIGILISNAQNNVTYISLLNLFKSILSGAKIINLSPYGNIFPNIALSTIFTISLLYFFINPKITRKEKITNLISIIFIIFLFYSKTLNYIANCFHVPAGYDFRYSFIISFYFIIIFIKNYKVFDNKIDKKVYFINILLFILILIEYLTKNLELKYFIFNLSFLITLTTLFIFYKNNKIYKFIFTSVIVLEVTISAILNITCTIKEDTTSHEFNKEYITYREQLDHYNQDFNINLYDNINTIPSFSSMQYNWVFEDLSSLGYLTDSKAIIYISFNTKVFKMLFNVKDKDNKYLEKIYSVNKDILTYTLSDSNIITNQNNLVYGLTGITNIIEKKDLKNISKEEKFKHIISKKGTYYFYFDNDDLEQIIVNNTIYTYDKNSKKDTKYKVEELRATIFLELELDKKDIIKLKFKDNKKHETYPLYYLNESKYEELYNILEKNQITYTHYQDNLLEGKITVDKNEVIFTTIPYDKHWRVTIDNKEVETKLVLNSLMGIVVPEGTHHIKLEYKPNYIIPIIISTTTFIGLIVNIVYQKLKKKND